MTVTDENRPWNKNIPASSSTKHSTRNNKIVAVPEFHTSSPPNIIAEKKIKNDSCSRPTKNSRKHRNSSFLNRIRLGKDHKDDSSAVGNDSTLLGSTETISFSSFNNRDMANLKTQSENNRKITQDEKFIHAKCSTNSNTKSKSDGKKSHVNGIKRFMKKKNHISSSLSSNGFESEEKSSLQSNIEKDTMKDGARIHLDVYDTSNTIVVKKRKSDEGLPSALVKDNENVQKEQILFDKASSHNPDKGVLVQREEQQTMQLHEKDPKRLRESLSPVQATIKTSSFHMLTMPPVEKLALNCSDNTHSASGSSTLTIKSNGVNGDINSSMSSNSPMSMEPDAFSSLYQDDSDDDVDTYDKDNYPKRHTVRGIDFSEAYKTKFVGFSSTQGGRLCTKDDEEDDCHSDQEDEPDSDQDIYESGGDDSDASTVVNSLPPARLHKPPSGATKEEQDRFYWELCYGKSSDPKKKDDSVKPPMSFSASTKVPAKSCLSAKKTPWTEIANSASKRIALKKSLATGMVQNGDGTPGNDKSIVGEQTIRNASFCTPLGNDNYPTKCNSDGKKSVKFGALSAAEFESTRPTVELTPLPAEQVKEEFGLENRDEESDDDSTEMHQETARNADKLAMWEDDFDSYCDDWDNNDSIISLDGDSDEEKLQAFVPRKRNSRGSLRHGRASMGSEERKRGSGDRRSSIFFSKSGGSLLEPEDIDMEPQSTLQDNLTEAPSFRITSNAEHSEKGASATSRDSLQFSSPSTVSGSFLRLSHSGSETSKVTPTTEITSSSNVLRSVHSEGGASISAIANCRSPECTDLKPSQLDYALKHVTSVEYSPENAVFNCSSLMVGERLKSVKTNFRLDHEISSLLAIEDTLSNISVDFIDFIEDLDMLCQETVVSSQKIGLYEVFGVLEMAVTLLEEVNSSTNDFDERKLCAVIESMNASFETSEIDDTYSVLAETALINWLEQEVEALEAANEWLLPIVNFNLCEEQLIIQALSIITSPNLLIKQKRHGRNIVEQDKIMVIIEEMDHKLREEIKQLEGMKHESCILAWKCELGRSKKLDVRQYQLLTSVLPYICALDKPPLSIRTSHLDGTQTLLSWDMADGATEKGKRDSICTVESVERTAASIMTIPNTYRLKSKVPNDVVQDLYGAFLREGSDACKLYSRFLGGSELQKYMKDQFQAEHEMGILTVSDTFQRMNLMAMDVLQLENNGDYIIEATNQSSLAILRMPVKISETCAVEIRFIYDLSSSRTFFNFVPTDVSIASLHGPTASNHMMNLAQVARNALNKNSGSNAFILNRTCSEIIEFLKMQH